jgi:hypothetical protein
MPLFRAGAEFRFQNYRALVRAFLTFSFRPKSTIQASVDLGNNEMLFRFARTRYIFVMAMTIFISTMS